MAAKSQTREIAGIKITAHHLPPLRAFPLSVRVAKVVVALLGSVDVASLRRGEIDGPTALVLLEALGSDQKLVPDLLAACQAQVGKELVDLDSDEGINLAFAGKMLGMLHAAVFSAQVNFTDFFDDVFSGSSDVAAALETMAAQGSPA